MIRHFLTALVAVIALAAAPVYSMAADVTAFASLSLQQKEQLAGDIGLAIAKSFGPLDTSKTGDAAAPTPVIERPALVELGVYIQSGQIRSANILADGGPFYVNDDTPAASATIWVFPKDASIDSVGVADIPVKQGIELSLANVPTEAMIIVLVGGCPDLSVFGGKPMYSRLIHTYTAIDGKTDTVAVVDCPT